MPPIAAQTEAPSARWLSASQNPPPPVKSTSDDNRGLVSETRSLATERHAPTTARAVIGRSVRMGPMAPRVRRVLRHGGLFLTLRGRCVKLAEAKRLR